MSAQSSVEKDAAEVTFTVGDGWPTPNACRRTADALDAITPARYGDILRAYADAEDARFAAHGPVRNAALNAEDACWCDGPDCGQTPCVEVGPTRPLPPESGDRS